MATGVVTWSKTASSNATADSSVNWAEGQSPSSVNDSARGVMASVAKWRDDLNGTLTAGGTATAYTVTTNQTFAALAAGLEVCFVVSTTNGASATLNVDSLGAKALKLKSGTALDASVLKVGAPYRFVYSTASSGEWIIQGITNLAASEVSTTYIADDAVTTAKILNSNVTLAKIANIATSRVLANVSGSSAAPSEQTLTAVLDAMMGSTRGSILRRGASAWEIVAPGTSGHVLTSNGTGADPSYQAGGSMALISTQVASNSATIDFTTGLDDTYDHYELVISSAKPTNDDVTFQLLVGTGAGPTWISSGYTYGLRTIFAGTTNDVGSAGSTHIPISLTGGAAAGVGNATGESYSGTIRFDNPDAANIMNIAISGVYTRAGTPQTVSVFGGGEYTTATAVTGLRFLFSSGNISSGRFALYGFKKA